MSPEEQLQRMRARAEKFIGGEGVLRRLKEGRRLRVKLGVDPTRPDLTFGHMVVFRKLREFQDMGHQAVLIIGDYTTRIGDPTGKSETRPVLSEAEIEENARTYLDQAFRILDPGKTEVRRNSEWFGKMSFLDALQLSRRMTVAQMLARDDFAKRHAANVPISLVEFLYPLLQGHDSVELKADVEIGGSDQLFNMLVGRDLQEQHGQPPQAVLGMPLLVGLDGDKKMSKSLGNYIAFNHPAKDMFGRIMSVPDATMWAYYDLLLLAAAAEVAELRVLHPMEAKKRLAARLTDIFHGEGAGARERAEFENVFSKGGVRSDMPEFAWDALSGGAAEVGIVDLLAATNLFPSKKEIRRLIEGGAVRLGEEKVADPARKVARPAGELVIQAGKRTFLKVK
ncbi:MAG: tyrosine--tRNA ligase [Verrucomicrobia bacterium]|nr:tyrosine--tRNA ligase [Verrucomicrobiota bacterium]